MFCALVWRSILLDQVMILDQFSPPWDDNRSFCAGLDVEYDIKGTKSLGQSINKLTKKQRQDHGSHFFRQSRAIRGRAIIDSEFKERISVNLKWKCMPLYPDRLEDH
jgi:hypothetical protein